MNKARLINIVAKEAGISKRQATTAVECLFQTITQCLRNGEKVQLVGFGRFTVTQRIPRRARIPGTTTIVEIPPHKTAKFTAGKSLKSALN